MLETERLILRKFTLDDAQDVFEYLEHPLVHCFECFKMKSIDEVKEELKKRAENNLHLAIVLKEENKVIGEIDAMAEPADSSSANQVVDTYSPCWMLNEKYFGKGYAYEAAHCFFEYLFEELNARRIYAYTEDYNISSQKLCRKLGMREEGCFKEFIAFVNDDEGNPIYENTMQFAILKKEWKK